MRNNVDEKAWCRKSCLYNIILVLPKVFREVWFLFLLRTAFLGKGVQIQQKYVKDSIKKVRESVLPMVSCLTKFCNEVDAMYCNVLLRRDRQTKIEAEGRDGDMEERECERVFLHIYMLIWDKESTQSSHVLSLCYSNKYLIEEKEHIVKL